MNLLCNSGSSTSENLRILVDELDYWTYNSKSGLRLQDISSFSNEFCVESAPDQYSLSELERGQFEV